MLHSILLAILATQVAGSAIQDPIGLQQRKSYIDQIYGDLVDTPSARQYKASQQLESSFVEAEPFEDPSYQDAEYLARALKRKAAHDGYLRSRSDVNYPDDDDTSDLSGSNLFGGIITYADFPSFNCFDKKLLDKPIDIAIVGAPFDTGVSYRPGARFGPDAIRSTAKRLSHGGANPARGNTRDSPLVDINPYDGKLNVVDCGDVPMTPFDNRIALNQLYRGQRAIHSHKGKNKPRIITMGGDHTITLMALRSAFEQYGQLAVLHFDSHIDTWDPSKLGGGITDYMSLNHGTFLHYASEQGYLAKDHCFHLGIRAPYIDSKYDKKHDRKCGFEYFTARYIDHLGRQAMVDQIKNAVQDIPVYISVDIDVLDPSHAPGTGTMEVGGWTTRELLSVLDSLDGLNVVGADVVEVSPPFDTNSKVTSLAATGVIDSILGLMTYSIKGKK